MHINTTHTQHTTHARMHTTHTTHTCSHTHMHTHICTHKHTHTHNNNNNNKHTTHSCIRTNLNMHIPLWVKVLLLILKCFNGQRNAYISLFRFFLILFWSCYMHKNESFTPFQCGLAGIINSPAYILQPLCM